jgi:hypothetical protein
MTPSSSPNSTFPRCYALSTLAFSAIKVQVFRKVQVSRRFTFERGTVGRVTPARVAAGRSSAINLSSPRRGLSLEYHTPQRSERSSSRRQVAALISTHASGMVNAIVRDRDRGAQPAGTH